MEYKNRKKDIFYPLAIAAVLAIGLFLGYTLKKQSGRTSLTIYPKTDKLTSVLNFIEDQYVDTVEMGMLVESAIPTLLKNLDPHSVYIPASDLKAVNEPLDGGFDGIGISFNMPSDTIVVMTTIPGGPSERIGIMPGDRILTIDDSLVAGVKLPQEDVMKMLKGPNGTKVKLGIARTGVPDIMHFDLIRDKIPIYSIDISFMVEPGIGFIKISRFARTTYTEFVSAVENLQKQGMEKIIIDLRGNNGGYLDQATNIANEFLPEGKLIVYTQGKARARQNVYSNSKGSCIDIPVAVIIDEFSASASEILAGAIQDNDRGKVIGRRSFGKGLVQEQVLFSDGSALRLTIARYYTPTGRSIQKPYVPGNDDYYHDISNRYLHGEFQEIDSIRLDDSLKFTTPMGRTVYGGGGIMPDFFIPMDTTGTSPYFNQVARRNLIYRFAFQYSDRNRKNLSSLKTHTDFISYLKGVNIMEQFIAFADKQGVKPNKNQINTSKKIIETQLMAYIARNIIDDKGFYPIITQIDSTLLKTIEIIKQEVSESITALDTPFKPSMRMFYLSYSRNQVLKDLVAGMV
ncbi:MAG: S41 family peptidase [Tenuifilaceae bacterium]|jgi:carboxyl-terminal processing protease|nr:S41 family peptidase [Tenuifilaceae bacterium]